MAKPSFYPKIEEKILEFWKKNNIFQKSIDQRDAGNSYVFYDGPPFATGTPHYGHLVPSLIKDIIPRFQTMKGKRVERRWGWDCHGLPIENIVEKELKLHNRKEILKYGVDRFNGACHSKIMMYADEWKKTITRYGRWVDMERSYKTMDLDFMESVWWVFKQLWDRELIYEGRKAMHICPRCETVLSNFEVAENYQEVEDLSVVVAFPLEDEPNTALLAWTTTPWSLPGNMLVAIHPNVTYAKVKMGDQFYVLAKDRVQEVMGDRPYEVVEELAASQLDQRRVQPLFPYFKETPNAFRVVLADFVSTDEGTGVVHVAPGFGEEDAELGTREHLEPILHVGMNGAFTDGVKDFAGRNARASDAAIVEFLKAQGRVFHSEPVRHSYPHCWRCDTALLNYTTTSWFVAVTNLKDAAVESAKAIHWVPDHVKEGRFGRWLADAKDWSISRSRYWGTPLPIWRNIEDATDILCFGSRAELEQACGQSISDLHKHIIDPIEIHRDGKTYRRIDEVLDCWFESGSMPFAQKHYPFENKETFAQQFPADFIAESQDQTTRWFYVLHVIATALTMGEKSALSTGTVQPAFEHVVVNGMVLAEDGKKMSKRLKNYPEPDSMFERYGADCVRYYLATSPVMRMQNLNFSEKDVEEILKKIVMITLNVLSFYKLYEPKDVPEMEPTHALDRWMLAELYHTWNEVDQGYNDYEIVKATRPLESFINVLSTWYVRRSRDRFKGDDAHDKLDAQWTLRTCLMALSKLMAPVMPFLAEHLHQELRGEEESVHLTDWPDLSKEGKIKWNNEGLREAMQQLRLLASLGLEARAKAGIPIRQPLAELKVSEKQLSSNDATQLEQLLKDELNVRAITWGALVDGVELDTMLTPELEMEGMLRELTRVINQQRKNKGMKAGQPMTLFWSSNDPMVQKVFQRYAEVLKKNTVASDLRNEERRTGESVEIRGSELRLDLDAS